MLTLSHARLNVSPGDAYHEHPACETLCVEAGNLQLVETLVQVQV